MEAELAYVIGGFVIAFAGIVVGYGFGSMRWEVRYRVLLGEYNDKLIEQNNALAKRDSEIEFLKGEPQNQPKKRLRTMFGNVRQ